MGESLPDRESLAAGNCKGRELEDQSSSAWGSCEKIRPVGAPSELITSCDSLEAACPHAAISTNFEFFHSSGRIRGHLRPCSGRDSTSQCPVHGRHERTV